MFVRVQEVTSKADLEEVFRFRYRVYVEELHKPLPSADPQRRMVTDELDAGARVLVAVDDAAGTIVGSGTVSNEDRARGSSCLAEQRMLEKIDPGAFITPFMAHGDHVAIEMFDADGQRNYDTAFALLIGKLLPAGKGLQGFVLAAILGAVVSSLASMLNSASTIFTMDLFRKYVNPDASQRTLVRVGRVCVVVFVIIGCLISPLLGNPNFGGRY